MNLRARARYGTASVVDLGDEVVLGVRTVDGMVAAARLPAHDAARIGSELQVTAARIVARDHAGKIDVGHLETECAGCGAPFAPSGAGSRFCSDDCRERTPRTVRRVDAR